jgi:hypothetical protein
VGKKRSRPKQLAPPPEIEVIGAGDIVIDSLEPIPDPDAATITSLRKQAELKEHLERFVTLDAEAVPERIIDLRDLNSDKIQRATAYVLIFVSIREFPENEVLRFDES